MPLVGPNTGPTVSHDNMVYYESASVNPMKFFLEPIAVVLNYVDDEYNFSDVTMVGLSGGGWTTHLYAAIDTRITASFPVAGSLPLYLHEGACGEDGDYEQGKPAHLIKLSPMVSFFYEQVASYLDLYILASYGLGRTQIQILNQFDSCCFWGIES